VNQHNALTSYFDKAMTKIQKLGLATAPGREQLSAIMPLIQRIEHLDPENALSIARVMDQSSNFNEIVRTKISSIEIGARFLTISSEFDDIREDTRNLVAWMEDGNLDWKEKAQMTWMELRRGTVSERFGEIQKTFAAVMEDTNDQILMEESVLSAYLDFRFSIKESESSAYLILAKAEQEWAARKNDLVAAGEKIKVATDQAEKSKFELERDQLLAETQSSETLYQIAKDLAENLKVAYNTSELVFARLQQNIGMKRRIYEQSVTFFTTNEVVFTGLSAAFTSTQGLAESTHALESMKRGLNQSIEALADIGGTQLEASTRAGYSGTVDAKSVAKLANAIVEYQQTLGSLVTDLRKEATTNAEEIETATNAAKESIVALLAKAK
jgi:hypothetical protein